MKDGRAVRDAVGRGLAPRLALATVLCAVAACCRDVANKTGKAAPRRVTIYVAASTRDVVAEITTRFTEETGIRVEINAGSSSRLAQQILEGGPADLLLSADQANADHLASKGFVAQRRNLLGNRLVVITPADSSLAIASLDDLARADIGQLALALESVPAGQYARQALERAGIWKALESRVIGGDDVRATLAFVEHDVDAGIVYRTDAAGSGRVRVALEIDEHLHEPIEYPLILVARDSANDNARALFDYLASDEAAAVFRKAQFTVIP